MTFCPFCQTRIHITVNNHVIPIHDKEVISKLTSENELLNAEILALRRVMKTQQISFEMAGFIPGEVRI